jgi:hypothetical protein
MHICTAMLVFLVIYIFFLNSWVMLNKIMENEAIFIPEMLFFFFLLLAIYGFILVLQLFDGIARSHL